MSQQHARVSQGRCTCYQTEIGGAAQTLYLTQSGRTAARVSMFKSLVGLDLEKGARSKREPNPGLPLSKRTSLLLGQRGGLFIEGQFVWLVGWLVVGWLQERIYSDNFTCCHTEIEVADQTFHLTQSQFTDTGPTSPSTDPITPGA